VVFLNAKQSAGQVTEKSHAKTCEVFLTRPGQKSVDLKLWRSVKGILYEAMVFFFD
jgi:hypothetical protein